MSVKLTTLHELNKRAEAALIKEMCVVDTLRFLSQFRTGAGDYTAERKRLFEGMSVRDIVREIKERRT
jgi:hypothetical protein